jgi:hypothetical protein
MRSIAAFRYKGLMSQDRYPQLGTIPWQGFAFMESLVVVGLLIFFIARAIRASQGINLDLIYRRSKHRSV